MVVADYRTVLSTGHPFLQAASNDETRSFIKLLISIGTCAQGYGGVTEVHIRFVLLGK